MRTHLASLISVFLFSPVLFAQGFLLIQLQRSSHLSSPSNPAIDHLAVAKFKLAEDSNFLARFKTKSTTLVCSVVDWTDAQPGGNGNLSESFSMNILPNGKIQTEIGIDQPSFVAGSSAIVNGIEMWGSNPHTLAKGRFSSWNDIDAESSAQFEHDTNTVLGTVAFDATLRSLSANSPELNNAQLVGAQDVNAAPPFFATPRTPQEIAQNPFTIRCLFF